MKLSDPIKLPSGVASLLNLHIAGVFLLVVLNIVLLFRLGLAWSDLGSGRQAELQQKQLQLAQIQAQTARLNGLPEKVELSRKAADRFYEQRIPANYSSFLIDLGALVAKNHVRFTRAGYTQSPAIAGLAEVRIDANLAGQYTDVMHFINELETGKIPARDERAAGNEQSSAAGGMSTSGDKTTGESVVRKPGDNRPFFIITALTLTGQQGGLVNLRLRLTTYLHASDASQLPPSTDEPAADPAGTPSATPATDQSVLRQPALNPAEGQ